MYKIILVLVAALFMSSLNAQNGNAVFDKKLADSLGADEYGMKMYVMAILKTGKAQITEKATRDSLFRGHMKNIKRLAEGGLLVVAGPFEENKMQYEGIFIFNVKTIEEAKALLVTDPAVKADLLDPELYQWYGSAALPLYLKYHDKVRSKSF